MFSNNFSKINFQKLFPIFFFIICLTGCKNSETTEKKSDTKTDTETSTINTSDKNIIFFGNSLTAAYGLEDPTKGFVSLIQQRIDSLKLPFHCVNAGLSGETTAGGAERVDWIIAQQPFDIFMLELGGNDALRGTPAATSEKNLQTIIDKVRDKNPKAKIILAGMEAPRNLGKIYTDAFHEIYPTLAKRNNITLIPFILDKVGGVSGLNQPDGIHPNIAGNLIVRENIWSVVNSLLTQS